MLNSGFLFINKPINFTSFDVVAVIRKKLGIKKVGHTGTLDPLATGLMIVGVGEACKYISRNVSDNKTYKAKIILGKISKTFDGEGPIYDTNFKGEVKLQKILETLDSFKGKISQVPPMYSAIKVEGKKLCDLARKGESINIQEREVEIFNIDLISFEYPEIIINVKCSSGTYIRSLANDIGKRLGCGAYLGGLKRVNIEDFDIKDSINLEDVSFEKLLPIDFFLKKIPILNVDENILKRLEYGQRISIRDLKINDIHGEYRIYFNGKFYGVGELNNGVLKGKGILTL